MAEEKKDETVENIVALTVIAIVILVTIGFWNNWWGWFAPQSNNPITSTKISGEPSIGDPNAPITIVEYSDFECPFCGRFHSQVLPQLKEKYVDTGKARLVFKNFPLTQIHENAMNAAMASECVQRQNESLFWDYHDTLFENQHNLSYESLKSYAGQLDLNMKQFELCLSNQATKPEVENDYREGVEAGITGTPGFVIGKTSYPLTGEVLIGAQPLSKFDEIINRMD